MNDDLVTSFGHLNGASSEPRVGEAWSFPVQQIFQVSPDQISGSATGKMIIPLKTLIL